MSDPQAQPVVRELHAEALRLAVRADLGGAIAGFWHGADPLLRSTEPQALLGARQAACYPLIPYSNRIGNRRFHWQGHDYTTAPNFDDSPHSLHGVGWLRPWTVTLHTPSELVLGYRHLPDADWPFAFDASQTYTLTPSSLEVRLGITNTSAAAQPVGLGWHPYIPKHADDHLHAEVRDRWDPDAAGLPVRSEPQAAIDGAVQAMDYDHCFSGWNGRAVLESTRYTLLLESSLDHLVVYTPPQKAYFCVEPVSHLSNAINRADPAAHGLRTLKTGERFEAAMTWRVVAS